MTTLTSLRDDIAKRIEELTAEAARMRGLQLPPHDSIWEHVRQCGSIGAELSVFRTRIDEVISGGAYGSIGGENSGHPIVHIHDIDYDKLKGIEDVVVFPIIKENP